MAETDKNAGGKSDTLCNWHKLERMKGETVEIWRDRSLSALRQTGTELGASKVFSKNAQKLTQIFSTCSQKTLLVLFK